MRGTQSFAFHSKGQGALEYLLLIGGAVLVATLVMLVIITSTSSTNQIINNNITQYQNTLAHQIGFGGGGPGPSCGNGTPDPGEQCDGAYFGSYNCASFGYSGPENLSCTGTCTIDISDCTGPGADYCGDNVINPPVEVCDGTGLGGNDCTTIPGDFTSGTLACYSNCLAFNTTQCSSAVPDTTPPSNVTDLSVFSTTPGQADLSWSAASDNVGGSGIKQYEIKQDVTEITDLTYNSVQTTYISNGLSLSLPGLTQGSKYCFAVKAVDFASNVSTTVDPPASASQCVTIASGGGGGITNFTGAYSSGSAGIATFNFSWTGSTFPNSVNTPFASLQNPSGIYASYLPINQGIVAGESGLVAFGTYMNHTPPLASPQDGKPLFDITQGGGTQTGIISATLLKSLAGFSASNPVYFIMTAEQSANPGSSEVITSASAPYPDDVDAPNAITGFAPATGASNGAQLSVTWNHPLDVYVGGTYAGNVDYQVAYDSVQITTPAQVAGLVSAGKAVSGTGAGGTSGLNVVLDYQTGLVPSASYYTAVQACEKVDNATVVAGTANCTESYSAASTPASKETYSTEAETFASAGTSILSQSATVGTITPETQNVITTNSANCTNPIPAGQETNVTVNYSPITLKAPSSPSTTPFYVWVRGANTSGTLGTRYVKVSSSLNPSSSTIVGFTSPASAFVWRSAGSVSWAGGNPTITLMFSDQFGVAFCNNQLKIDEIYITSTPSAGCNLTSFTGKSPAC
ncbi:MAG: class III signal peptide-containing protein [Candidatus Diapherotrites archaeon]|nr:class III signal peptide-containing protein [Candidatus Diapherotrites archaeon]